MDRRPLGNIKAAQFIERLALRPASVDALLTFMDYPGMPGSVRDMTTDEKIARARSQAIHLQKELPEYANLTVDDVLVCEFYGAYDENKLKIPYDHFRQLFGPVEEAELTKPFSRFFYRRGYSIFLEVPIGKSRADIVAYKPGELIAVELKTKVVQLKKCFAQLMDYQTGVDRVYLGTTAGTLVKYLTHDIDRIEPGLLEVELSKCGAGLIIFDYVNDDCETITEPPGPSGRRQETREWLLRRCEAILNDEVPTFVWSE